MNQPTFTRDLPLRRSLLRRRDPVDAVELANRRKAAKLGHLPPAPEPTLAEGAVAATEITESLNIAAPSGPRKVEIEGLTFSELARAVNTHFALNGSGDAQVCIEIPEDGSAPTVTATPGAGE